MQVQGPYPEVAQQARVLHEVPHGPWRDYEPFSVGPTIPESPEQVYKRYHIWLRLPIQPNSFKHLPVEESHLDPKPECRGKAANEPLEHLSAIQQAGNQLEHVKPKGLLGHHEAILADPQKLAHLLREHR